MYPLDRRSLVHRIYLIMGSYRKTANALNVSHMTVSRWMKDISRKPYPCKKHTKSEKVRELLISLIQIDPFISIKTLKHRIFEILQVSISNELLRLVIKKNNFTKKNARHFSSPKNLEQKTKEFLAKRDLYISEGRRFVSIDETSFGRHGKMTRGYSKKGERLVIQRKATYITTTSCLVAMSSEKLLKIERVVGSYNTILFMGFLNAINLNENDVVLLDNVSFHHSKIVKEWAYEHKG